MRARSRPHPGLTLLMAAVLTAFSGARAQAMPARDIPPIPPGTPRQDSLAGIAYVSIGTSACPECAARVCPGDSVVVSVWGTLGTCEDFLGLSVESMTGFAPVVVADFEIEGGGCIDGPPFYSRITLPATGVGQRALEVVARVNRSWIPPIAPTLHRRRLRYEVLATCPEQTPLESLARTFTSLRVLPEHPRDGDAVSVQLVKDGCSPCVHLRRFEFPWDPPYELVAALDWVPDCGESACNPETLSVPLLGPLPSGPYAFTPRITVNVRGTSVPDSSVSYRAELRFSVGTSFDSTSSCVLSAMQAPPAPLPYAAQIEPGASGSVPLSYSSAFKLGRAAGRLEMFRPFRVADLRLAQHLIGGHLTWTEEPRGVRWVVFTDPGVTLPAGDRQHLLDATLAVATTATPGEVDYMLASLSLATDVQGNELPFCMPLRPSRPLLLRVAGASTPALRAAALGLSPARPNPFTHSTTFTIGLPREANVELAVHDLAGRRVATLAHGHVAAGDATYTWDGAGARDGVYFVRLSVDGRVLSTRVALLRGGH